MEKKDLKFVFFFLALPKFVGKKNEITSVTRPQIFFLKYDTDTSKVTLKKIRSC